MAFTRLFSNRARASLNERAMFKSGVLMLLNLREDLVNVLNPLTSDSGRKTTEGLMAERSGPDVHCYFGGKLLWLTRAGHHSANVFRNGLIDPAGVPRLHIHRHSRRVARH